MNVHYLSRVALCSSGGYYCIQDFVSGPTSYLTNFQFIVVGGCKIQMVLSIHSSRFLYSSQLMYVCV